MNKIPVTRTIAHAYSFTFGHLGTIIGLIWIPMVAATALGYFVMREYFESFSAALTQNNPAIAGQAALMLFFYVFVMLLLYAMIYVSVTKQALGIRTGAAMAHVELGPAVWRMFGAMLGAFAIVLLLYTLIAAVGLGGLAAVSGGNPTMAGGVALGLGLLIIVGVGALIYIAVRLVFFLAPVVVAEDRVGLGRAWELTSGNFWRIFLIWLATLAPLFLIMLVVETFILGPAAMTSGVSGAIPTPAEQAQQMRLMSEHLPALSGLGFLLSPFLTGLTVGAAAFAYREVAPARGAAAS